VQEKQRIFVAADGVYHQINLNTIFSTNGNYLLEKYEIHGLLNARQLVNKAREETAPSSIVLMAPVFDFPKANILNDTWTSNEFGALPGSLEEVNSIISLLKPKIKQATLLQGHVANEVNFKRIKSPSILHIATHGFFSSSMVYLNEQTKNSHLFHSGILLSPTYSNTQNTENAFGYDGIITAYDVMTLDLTHTDLVVLSACETGLGKIATSEGVYGLQRSFMQAGASDLIISLWKVDDDMTKALMVKFYVYLTQNFNRRESFKRAQLDLLNEVGNPRHWGGFVMVSGN
jgi:CHAT domain-containing protein